MPTHLITTRLLLGTVIFLQLYTIFCPYERSLAVHDGRLLSSTLSKGVHASRKLGISDQLPSTSFQLTSLSEELLNPWSHVRLLTDHIASLKSLQIVSEEELNVDLSEKLSGQLQASQRLLSRLPAQPGGVARVELDRVLRQGSALVYEARQLHYDSANLMMKLKGQLLQQASLTEEANVKATFYGQLAAESMPKGLHCLTMTLTLEAPTVQRTQPAGLLPNTSSHHLCIFSDNVVAVAAVVNSTVVNSRDPSALVFHIVTDSITERAMQSWFRHHPPGTAGVQIQKVEDFSWLNASYVPVLKQMQDAAAKSYYFKASSEEAKATMKFHNPKYVAMLNHLRFYLPEIFPNLDRVVFLDDDVIVQRDLSPLFSIDLKGNVNGAVETCGGTFHRYHKYLNFSHPLINHHLDPEGCGWAYGMNVFDLKAWRQERLTERYHFWQQQNVNHTLWQLGTLPPGLLTFHGLTLPLNRSWHVLGLGYNVHVDSKEIENGSVIHWNGNRKPWLKLGIPRYKPLWDKYVDFDERHLRKCNVV